MDSSLRTSRTAGACWPATAGSFGPPREVARVSRSYAALARGRLRSNICSAKAHVHVHDSAPHPSRFDGSHCTHISRHSTSDGTSVGRQ
jgi:hypothetical protein